ncbi:glycine cleavage system protein H [Tuwongella immobilis]|uniref:Lipoyl-binding domain-containing protein n=1 Tax=Tuwongella immobilis TaxID=692036 RepID=A0A6C2YSK1_9BACT|nr:glycine cleavage system protein H [Tuwongella immobilis]VIP04670.1 Glycine cleavage H-protein OS=Pirellula staleyi (strain ATCC 27377 / DSM 6068 / ICPB 4128) GN=Psta_4504 PE=4 SV=1: GCV_H [Tuwongella immobilis]VTS06700.1 Glycine cleavage H-protein OS=Pirellula staleyi (strain ATCC 27377 / DSM 6068 / ICPB 4128) GN=Psta_4504 PE=4 SV=1: GCV_H [Tuwongella immobilis]
MTPENLVFDMGKFPAAIPGDRRYCKNHMWCLTDSNGQHRFGFTAYAIRLMQDVYFLEWCVNEGDTIALKQQIGNIETSKATSDLFAPIAGQLTIINGELLKDPSAINADCYTAGWLFEMAGEATNTLSPSEYHAHLTATWENTQRILKGQMHD